MVVGVVADVGRGVAVVVRGARGLPCVFVRIASAAAAAAAIGRLQASVSYMDIGQLSTTRPVL